MKKIVIFLLFGLIGCNDYTEYINKGDEIIYKLENDSLFLQSVTNGNYLYKKWTNEESVFLMYSSEDLSVYKEIIEGEKCKFPRVVRLTFYPNSTTIISSTQDVPKYGGETQEKK